MTSAAVEGGCLCGAVRYRVTGQSLARALCHCHSCRLASGAPSVAWAVFPASQFAIVSGKPNSYRSSPPVVRTFCGNCGTPLTYQHGLIYLDKPANGGVAAYEDGFTLLELTRKYYREAGLDARQLDLLIR